MKVCQIVRPRTCARMYITNVIGSDHEYIAQITSDENNPARVNIVYSSPRSLQALMIGVRTHISTDWDMMHNDEWKETEWKSGDTILI